MQCTNCCSENEPDEMPICYGAIDVGVEAFPNHINSPSSTYLKGVDWATLGDVNLENSVELCAHLPQIDVVTLHERMYLFNRVSVPYRFTEISNNEMEQMQEYEMERLKYYENQESDTESVDTFDECDGLLPDCCDSNYDIFNSETFPMFKPKKNVHFVDNVLIETQPEYDDIITQDEMALRLNDINAYIMAQDDIALRLNDINAYIMAQNEMALRTTQHNDLPEKNETNNLSEYDDLPGLIQSENNVPYILGLIANLATGQIHPLSEMMTWNEVMETFKDWKKFRGIETEETEESCMAWAKYIKKEWAKDMEKDMAKDMERTGEHYPEVVIPEEDDNETSQDTDLHNQTGIFDWTPTNRRDRIEFLKTRKYKQCDDFDC